MKTSIKTTALAGAVMLALAACGGGGGGGSTPAPTTDTTSGEESPSDDAPGGGGTINIGIKFDQPGLGLKVGNDFKGFDVDVARYVAEKLGYDNINFVESISSQRETMLQNGQVDLIFATYSITEKREDLVDFAGPYFVAGQDLLVLADNTDITGPDALNGKILCSVEGSTSAERIRTDYAEGVQLYPAQTYSECVEFLLAGTVEAVTTDDIILAGFANQDSYAGKFKVVGNPFSTENYGVGMPNNSTAQCEKVNEALTAMFEDGTWERLLAENAGEFSYNTEKNPPTLFDCK